MQYLLRKASMPLTYTFKNPECPECGRVFDIGNHQDMEELAYGHDCDDSHDHTSTPIVRTTP